MSLLSKDTMKNEYFIILVLFLTLSAAFFNGVLPREMATMETIRFDFLFLGNLSMVIFIVFGIITIFLIGYRYGYNVRLAKKKT